MPTQVKRAIPSPALLPAATGSHPSGHLLRASPAFPALYDSMQKAQNLENCAALDVNLFHF